MINSLAPVVLATMAALVGCAVGAGVGQVAVRRLRALVWVAGVALLVVTITDILPESFAALGLIRFIAAAGSGALLMKMVSRYIYHACPACAFTQAPRESAPIGSAAVLLLMALGVHSTLDGLGVVAGNQLAHRMDVGLLCALVLHKIPEGLVLSLLLVGTGLSGLRAFACGLAAESFTLVGGGIGLFAASRIDPLWMAAAFAHVGGGFAYLICGTLLPLKSVMGAWRARLRFNVLN